MPRYALKRGGEAVREEEEGEERVNGKPKRILQRAMKEAWLEPGMEDIKDKLSEVAKTHWKPQIEEALRETGYAKELEARAREIKYDEKVKKVWK